MCVLPYMHAQTHIYKSHEWNIFQDLFLFLSVIFVEIFTYNHDLTRFYDQTIVVVDNRSNNFTLIAENVNMATGNWFRNVIVWACHHFVNKSHFFLRLLHDTLKPFPLPRHNIEALPKHLLNLNMKKFFLIFTFFKINSLWTAHKR